MSETTPRINKYRVGPKNTVGSAHPALPSTIAALALHNSVFNGYKNDALFRSYLETIALGEHVSEGTLLKLLDEWNSIDEGKITADSQRERIAFLRANKVRAFELWLPAGPEYLPTGIRSLIRSLDKRYRYSEARGNTSTRYVHLPNTKTGRAIADEIIALGHVKLVIPRGSASFRHDKGLIKLDALGERIYYRFSNTFQRLPVTRTARQIERKAYLHLRIARSK